jgi:glycosyltransferase involved in cell wall biosynthesis
MTSQQSASPTHSATFQNAHVGMSVSAIVPARNEALCIAAVVQGLLALHDAQGQAIIAEVVVADNGSTDGTARVAQAAGARVVAVAEPGYGQACWAAVQASHGQILIFVDGDGAVEVAEAPRLIDAIHQGADLAIGVRRSVAPGAMSPPQRFGNTLACALMRLVWRMPATDLGPFRAISRDAFDALDMQDRAFGWTVEMQVRANTLGMRVLEVPVHWLARAAGVSKISGTVRGVWGAGLGILGMIARLWWRERQRPRMTFLRPRRPAAPPHSPPCAPTQLLGRH